MATSGNLLGFYPLLRANHATTQPNRDQNKTSVSPTFATKSSAQSLFFALLV